MATASLLWSSFNNGELSPLSEGRVDMPQYMKGGKIMLNMLPTVQGPAVRRGGTRFISNTGNASNPSVLIRFSRSQNESYVLEFYDQHLRFYFNGGLVLNTGIPYVISTPYLQSELFNTDGTPAISAAESADVIYLAHPNHPPQVLSFFGPTNWTIAPLVNRDGPWQDQNANLASTVYVTGAVAIGSSVTLTASQAIFSAGLVGSLIRIHQQDLTTLKPWEPGQKTPVTTVGVQRRSGFCTYQCRNASAGTAPSGGTTLSYVQTGGNTLIHTQGNAWDGDQSTTLDPIGGSTYFSTGMEWSYEDCGYGVLQITAFTDSTHVTATVLRQLPLAIVGSGNATNLWELGAWSAAAGYPAVVSFFRNRLTFAGGTGTGIVQWQSVVGDYTNFADLQFGQVLPDGAITVPCQSDQLNSIVYLSPADQLMVGTIGGEFIVGQQSISDPFGPDNVMVSQQSQYGGRAVTPIRVQQFTLFVTRSGRSVRESTFAFTAGPAGGNVSNDITVLSEHITQSGIIAMAWAKNPYTTIYMALTNGNLISLVYNPEQAVKAWSRHDVAAGGQIVSLAVVPSNVATYDDVYVCVRRTNNFNGSITTFYTIERIEQPFQNLPGDRQQDCFYVDCGATLNNTINATLLPGPGAQTKGATGVSFTAGSSTFVPTDVGRYIHYDYTIQVVADDGTLVPQATKAVVLITSYTSATLVFGTINVPFPNLMGSPIAANGWRMTVTQITNPLVAWQGWPISILGDGAAQPDQVGPFSGSITLQYPASVVQCGLKSPSVFQTMKPEGGDRTGSAMGKLKKVVRGTIRVLNTLGLKLGRNEGSLIEIEMRPPNTPNDQPPKIFTGDTERQVFNGQWDRFGRVMVVQDQPLPLTLCAIAVEVDVEEDS